MTRGPIHKLPPNILKSAKAGMNADGGGLFLNSKPTGQNWLFRFTSPATGKRREMGLGAALAVSLTAARTRAAELRAIVAAGTDPLGAEPAPIAHRTAGATLGDIFDSYYEANSPSWKNPKHRQQWRNSLATHAADLLRTPVASIDMPAIVAALGPIWTTKPETARRVRGRIEMLLDFAAATGHRPQGPNPAALQMVKNGLPRTKRQKAHFAALPVAAAPAAFRLIWDRRGTTGADALALTILCAFRPNETRFLQWSDIRADYIEIPAARMKAGRRHRVPLTDAARLILDRPPDGELVFPAPNGKPISDATMNATQRRLGIDSTVHGWRAVFRQWALTSGQSRDLAEDALAHALSENEVEAAYLRDADLLDQRRPMMAAWSKFLLDS